VNSSNNQDLFELTEGMEIDADFVKGMKLNIRPESGTDFFVLGRFERVVRKKRLQQRTQRCKAYKQRMQTKMPRIKNAPYPLFQKSGSLLICVTSVGMGFTLDFLPLLWERWINYKLESIEECNYKSHPGGIAAGFPSFYSSNFSITFRYEKSTPFNPLFYPTPLAFCPTKC